MENAQTFDQRLVVFTHERITLGGNSGTFVCFLAASADLTDDEVRTILDPEVEAGRLEYGHSEKGTLFVRHPEDN